LRRGEASWAGKTPSDNRNERHRRTVIGGSGASRRCNPAYRSSQAGKAEAIAG